MGLKPEFICTLHTDHDCEHRHYNNRDCKLCPTGKFVLATCKYRMEAVIIPEMVTETDEPPVVDQKPMAAIPDSQPKIEDSF
jgi:hypothetical protein